MTVGIVGLGLIGGSFAKAYRAGGHTVYASDIDRRTEDYALLSGIADGRLTPDRFGECDLLLLCVYVREAVRFLEENGSAIPPGVLVLDCCGTKRAIVKAGTEAARRHGFTFVGGHPMAGKPFSGIKHASADLFRGAPMVIVPPAFDDIRLLSRVRDLLSPAGFGRFAVTTAEEHDRIIAFTSQLPHIVSSAYIKSPSASGCKNLSAGSYRDMTRVARMNADMWTDLFLENKDCLEEEISRLITQLSAYRDALNAASPETLRQLIEEGNRFKKEADK